MDDAWAGRYRRGLSALIVKFGDAIHRASSHRRGRFVNRGETTPRLALPRQAMPCHAVPGPAMPRRDVKPVSLARIGAAKRPERERQETNC